MDRCLGRGEFFGQVLLRRELESLILTETRYPAGLSIPSHSHERGYFCFIRKGGYFEQYGQRNRTAGPSTLAFHPPGEVHSENFGSGEVISFNVEVDAGWLDRNVGVSRLFENAAYFEAGITECFLLRLYHEFREFDSISPLAIEGLVLETLAGAARAQVAPAQDPAPPWVAEVVEILRARFHETVTLAEIAGKVGIHPVHLASSFRKHQRSTIGEYVRRLRVDFARRQILRSEMPLAEIAAAAGFADQSHFTRCFKRYTGATPLAYRRLAGRADLRA
jgi:AraC family transcriptional regulator